MNYPLRINRYSIRRRSGGSGKHNGGDGIVREYEFLADAEFTLLTERRTNAPWGLNQGQEAEQGVNLLNGELLEGKTFRHVREGDVLRIETPGGGYGAVWRNG
jgi:N-methylhydantoinase B